MVDCKRIYKEIIENRKKHKFDGYTEKHHIVPRSLGGSNGKNNLVALSAREHFICHYLLTKIHEDDLVPYRKMIKAFMLMVWYHGSNQNRYVSSRRYKRQREEFSKIQSIEQSGENNTQYGKRWIYNLDLEETRRINKDEDLPEGWKVGRVVSFEKFKIRLNNLANKDKKVPYKKPRKARPSSEFVEDKRLIKKEKMIEKYRPLYELYKLYAWEEFILKTGYEFSQQNFVMRCKNILPEFESQRGISRTNDLSEINKAQRKIDWEAVDYRYLKNEHGTDKKIEEHLGVSSTVFRKWKKRLNWGA